MRSLTMGATCSLILLAVSASAEAQRSDFAATPSAASLAESVTIPFTLWMEWDSENNASTLISPQALALLGGDSTRRMTDLPVRLAPGVDHVIPTMMTADRRVPHDDARRCARELRRDGDSPRERPSGGAET